MEDKTMLHKPRLDGKTIFIAGNERDSALLAEGLREVGATVIYPTTKIPGKLTLEQGVDAKNEALSVRPDAVIIFDPMMKDRQGSLVKDQSVPFDDEPAIKLAKQLRKKNIPVMIMDRWIVDERELDRTEQRTMAKAGIEYLHRISTPMDNKLIVTINKIIAKNKTAGIT